MAIKYSFTPEDNLLIVEASGYDENLAEVEQYGLAIIDACKRGNFTRVLCNEICLEYRLGMVDTFESAKFLASQVPSIGKAAIVYNEKFVADARFWETVAVNRGLEVRVFNNLDAARRWLEG